MQGLQKLIKKKMKKKLSNKNIRRAAKKLLKQSKDDWLPENFRISDAWARRIREELLARSKEVKFQRKMKPFGAWALQKLEEEGKISNDDAKKKYTEVVGEIKTRKQWENFGANMRRKLGVDSVLMEINGEKQYYWISKNY